MTTNPSAPAAVTKARIVRCPYCAGDSVFGPDNAFRPFCSARCKTGDLGAWSSEAFRVPAQPTEDAAQDLEGLLPP